VSCSKKKKRRKLPLCWTREMASNCRPSLQQPAGASVQPPPSNVSHKAERGRRGKKEKDLFLPQTVKQTNKQRRLSLAVSCPLVLLSCCLLAVILIVAFCALIWIGLVILLLHLLVGEIENSN
jgi:hypothetical protein